MDIMGVRVVGYRYATRALEQGAVPYVGFAHEQAFIFPEGYCAVGHADDHGTYLAIPYLAKWLDIPVLSATVGFYYALIGLAAIVGLLGIALYFRTWTARAVAATWLVSVTGYVAHFGDVYLIPPCCAMACTPWVLWLAQRTVRPAFLLSGGLLLGFVIAAGNLMRAHAGTAVLLLAIPALGFAGQYSRKLRLGFFAAIAAIACCIQLFQLHLMRQSDAFIAQHSPQNAAERVHAHMLWHSMYIGMAFLRNPYGIEYNDHCGIAAAQRSVPGVVYCSAEYDGATRAAFFAQYRLDPLFFWQSIFAKFGITLLVLIKRSYLGLLAVWVCGLPKRVLCGMGAALALSALPGILVLPLDTYLLGYQVWISMIALMCVGAALDRWAADVPVPAWLSSRMPKWGTGATRWTYPAMRITAILVAAVFFTQYTGRLYAEVSKDLILTREAHEREQLKLLAKLGRLDCDTARELTQADWQIPAKDARLTAVDGDLRLVTDKSSFGYQILSDVPLNGSRVVLVEYDIDVESGAFTIGILNEAGQWVETAQLVGLQKHKGRVASFTSSGKKITLVLANNNAQGQSSEARVSNITVKYCGDLSTVRADALEGAKLR